jgi:sugar phosphate isomerase/epimerase
VKIAFSKPTRDLAEQRQLFTEFRPAGYTGLQLKGGQYAGYLGDPAGFTAAWGDTPGLTSALITMGTLDDAGVARLRETIAFAAATGSERVVFCHDHPRDGVTPADLRSFARTLSAAGRDSAADGVGLTVDTAHLVKSGVTDVPALIRDFAPVIDNIHLKDYADGEWRILGRGTLNFKDIAAALADVSYTAWLCVDEESPAPLAEGLTTSRTYLRNTLSLD